jgi:hypothetical protein
MLRAIPHGFDPGNPPLGWQLVMEVLARGKGSANREIEALLPTVLAGLRDPELYAEVMAEAWLRLRADRDMTKVLMDMAKADGGKIRVLPHEKGLLKEGFVEKVASKKEYWVDNPLVNTDHGALTHLIQDLVVNRALKRAGSDMTSLKFRALIGKAAGKVQPEQMMRRGAAVLTRGQELPAADLLWRFTYDSLQMGQINQPETIYPILRKLFDVR